MADIRSKLYELYSLEHLAGGRSCIHSIHPLAKLLATGAYLLCVISFDRYALARLTPYVFYPVIVTALAGIPAGMILRRTAVALPFCLFAGLSNLLLDRGVMIRLGAFPVTYGLVSLCAIVFRTVLCVSAVLILVAVTPAAALTAQLRRMHVPEIFILLFEMLYRYVGVLMGEASSMYTAYRLRSPQAKGLEMRHMGSFVGQLLIRSFDRAERVYHAMRCRGYALGSARRCRRPMKGRDYLFLALAGGLPVVFRLFDLPGLLATVIGGML